MVVPAFAMLAAVSGCGSQNSLPTTTGGASAAIAFSRAAPQLVQTTGEVSVPRDADIYVEQLPDKALRQVTRGPALDFSPTWSPDGATLAFSRETLSASNPPIASIFSARVGGGGLTRITDCQPPACMGDTKPAFSPTGDTIAFLRSTAGGIAIAMIRANGGAVHRVSLPEGLKPYSGPVWTADARHIAFSAYARGGDIRAYMSDPSGASLHPLRLCTGQACNPQTSLTLSRSGRRVAFVESQSDRGVLYLHRAQAPQPRRLIGCVKGACPADPAWSGDGTTLAFVMGQGFGGALYQLSVDSGRPVKLTSGSSLDSGPVWRP